MLNRTCVMTESRLSRMPPFANSFRATTAHITQALGAVETLTLERAEATAVVVYGDVIRRGSQVDGCNLVRDVPLASERGQS